MNGLRLLNPNKTNQVTCIHYPQCYLPVVQPQVDCTNPLSLMWQHLLSPQLPQDKCSRFRGTTLVDSTAIMTILTWTYNQHQFFILLSRYPWGPQPTLCEGLHYRDYNKLKSDHPHISKLGMHTKCWSDQRLFSSNVTFC